jgi:hypothetical protein
MKVFVQRCSNGVFHCRFYSVCSKSIPSIFGEFRHSSLARGMLGHLSHRSFAGHASDGWLTVCRVFPVFSVRMLPLLCRAYYRFYRQKEYRQ